MWAVHDEVSLTPLILLVLAVQSSVPREVKRNIMVRREAPGRGSSTSTQPQSLDPVLLLCRVPITGDEGQRDGAA